MNLTAFACVLIFVVLHQDVSAWKPRINSTEPEINIQEGESLKLTCQGEGEVDFTREKILTSGVPRTNCSVTSVSNFTHLICPKTNRTDTGWYACAAKGTKIKNDEQVINHTSENIAWIYVYVNSPEPFAVMEAEYQPIIAFAGRSAIIPCRTTRSNLTVKLTFNDDEDLEEIPVSNHSKNGFVVNPVSTSMTRQIWSCGIDDEPAVQTFYMDVYEPLMEFPDPEIVNRNSLHNVVSGINLILLCRIILPLDSEVKLRWLTPDSLPIGRSSSEDSDDFMTDISVIRETRLTINRIEKRFDGNYTCLAENDENESTSTSYDIKVMESYLKKYSPIAVRENETAIWRKDIPMYTNVTWKWFRGATEIEKFGDTNSSKYFHVQTKKKDVYVWGISRTDLSDSGDYRLQLSTGNVTLNFTLNLFVYAPPITTIRDLSPYYEPGKNATFICSAIGSPIPNVTWSFLNWTPDEENLGIKFPMNVRNETTKKENFSVTSRLNMTIDMTGNLTCRTCNVIACTEATKSIVVSDVPGIMNIRKIQGPITAGDNIILNCAASVYYYAENITWLSKDSEKLERDEIKTFKTQFTSQSEIRLNGVKKTDSGDYSCQAFHKINGPEIMRFSLFVNDASKAMIEQSNMKNSTEYINLKNNGTASRKFKCVAQGLPIPKLTWWKDNKEIGTKDGQYELSENNSKLYIKFFRDIDGAKYSCRAKNRLGEDERYTRIKIEGQSESALWISLVCVLIVIIIIVISYMSIKVHKERVLRKELLEAGLTHFVEGALECLNPDLNIDDQAELLPYDKKWEFPRDLLKLGKQLGSGAFGVVMKAEARGICEGEEVTTVAVKMVRRSAEPSYMKALSSELKIMIHLGRHLNVVNLLGACTKTILTKRELYVIVEYCRFGNLHNYLQRHRDHFIDQIDPTSKKIDTNIGKELLARSNSIDSQNRSRLPSLAFSRSVSQRSTDSNTDAEYLDYRQAADFADIHMSPDGGVLSNNSVQPGWRSNYRGDYKDQNLKPICTQDLLCWAWQVSRGMDYLSARKVLHGDLAARNILLADDNVVKICDFGLAKNMYKDDNYKKKGDGPLPIKWMAIESIRDRMFSTQSDVWSFGIVLWEFFTLARSPYPGMEAEKQYDRLIDGYRLEKPEYATDEIYEFMLQCWEAKPSLRPTFPELAEKIGSLLHDGLISHFVDLNTPYMDMNTLALQNGQSDYLTMVAAPDHNYLNSSIPVSDVGLDPNYLPMSSIKTPNNPGIFSPRPQLEESHFDFPLPEEINPIEPDSEGHLESVAILEPKRLEGNPTELQQNEVEPVKQDEKENLNEAESACHDFTNNKDSRNSNNRISDKVKDSHQNTSELKLQKNNKDLSPVIISGQNNYVNMPKLKNDPLKNPIASFNNPSYLIMSPMRNK